MSSRRAFLIATAGGFVVGQLAPPPRAAFGRTLGASHEVGHLLRDGLPDVPHAGAETCDVVVVGAGVAGLSAAWRLAPAGLDVRVLDLEPFVGGTSAWSEEGAVPHPWGAHYLPAPNVEARPTLRLLEDMGVVIGWDAAGRPRFDPRTLCHAPEERIFFEGRWHPGLVPGTITDDERGELARFGEIVAGLTERRGADGRYVFQIPIAESSRDPEWLALDRMSMASWLEREGLRSRFLRWYVRYATLDDFGAAPQDVSAWAGLHYFAARKLKSPELEGSHFLVWPEGNGRLVQELVTRSRAAIDQACLGVRVEPTDRGADVTCLDVGAWRSFTLRARAVVLAVPAFVARRLIATEAPLPERASSPWLVANLHVERAIDPDHAWDSVLFDAAGLGYVDASHQLTPPRDRTVLTYFRAFGEPDVAGARATLLGKRWDELGAMVLSDLASAHPDLGRRMSRMDLVVWGHGMPRPRVGFLGERPFEAAQRLARRVSWAHADVSGMALFEESQRAGVIAAEIAAADAGIGVGPTWT
jgi:hypothetical protein